MSKYAKLLRRLRRNPKNIRFDEICTLLESLGFEKRQNGTSHAWFTHKNPSVKIGIPVKRPFILPCYVRNALELLEFNGLIDEDGDDIDVDND